MLLYPVTLYSLVLHVSVFLPYHFVTYQCIMLVRSLWPRTLCFHPQNVTVLSLPELSILLSPIYMNRIFIKRHSTIVQGTRNVSTLLPTAQSFCQVPYFLSSYRANILFPFIEFYCSPKDKSRDMFARFFFTLL